MSRASNLSLFAQDLHSSGLTYPEVDGSADQVIVTDGSGILSFADQSGGLDSAGIIELVDSDYIQARQSNVTSSIIGGATTTTFTATANQTVFSSEGFTYRPSNLTIFYNGILLLDSDDYTATDGTSITLTSGATAGHKLTAVEYAVEVAISSWSEVSSTYTASHGDKLFVDVSSATATVTLPASASMGDEVRIVDATGNSATNNITINRNGHNINGAADNLVLDVNRAAIGLAYYNVAQGWVLMER